MQVPNLRPILDPVPWAIVGAVAARLYMPERSTRDVDIAIWNEDSSIVRQRLQEAGYLYHDEMAIGGSSWHAPDGFPLDVIELRDEWARQALTEAQSNRDPQGLPVFSLPYLALMKFAAGRVQDMADLTRMLGQADETQLERTRALFDQFYPDGCQDLESLIYLGRLELQEPGSPLPPSRESWHSP